MSDIPDDDVPPEVARSFKECIDAGCGPDLGYEQLSPAAKAAWEKHRKIIFDWLSGVRDGQISVTE